MGQTFSVTCGNCGNKFKASEGGGFQFYLLHCDTCGREKNVEFLEGKDPSTEEAEATAGKCRCGGQYKTDAPPRCPKCRSADLEIDHGGPIILYD